MSIPCYRVQNKGQMAKSPELSVSVMFCFCTEASWVNTLTYIDPPASPPYFAPFSSFAPPFDWFVSEPRFLSIASRSPLLPIEMPKQQHHLKRDESEPTNWASKKCQHAMMLCSIMVALSYKIGSAWHIHPPLYWCILHHFKKTLDHNQHSKCCSVTVLPTTLPFHHGGGGSILLEAKSLKTCGVGVSVSPVSQGHLRLRVTCD